MKSRADAMDCACVCMCVLSGKKEPGAPEEGQRHNSGEGPCDVAIPRTLH